MAKGLSAPSVTAGIAEEPRHKIALNLAMIKIALEPERAEAAKPATANINHAVVTALINILVQVPVTPVVLGLPAVENTPLVLALLLIPGMV